MRMVPFVLAISVFTAVESWAFSDADIRDSIQTVISMRHPTDTSSWWKSLGPNAPRIILNMYGETQEIYKRVRLLDALAWYDSPEATVALKREIENSTNQSLRNAAIHALVRSQGLKEKDYISKTLKSENADTRVATAKALNEVNDIQAYSMVNHYLQSERVGWAVNKVQKHRVLKNGSMLLETPQMRDREGNELVSKPNPRSK